jgi:PhnB protein
MSETHARCRLIPSLTVDGAKDAIEYYKRVFGAREFSKPMIGPNGKVMHAELALGDFIFFVNDEFPEMGAVSPNKLGGTAVTLQIYVTDADKTYGEAVAAGAKSLMEPADMFWGDRYSMIIDPWGHRWGVGTPKEQVSPDEMDRRMKQAIDEMKQHGKREGTSAA